MAALGGITHCHPSPRTLSAPHWGVGPVPGRELAGTVGSQACREGSRSLTECPGVQPSLRQPSESAREAGGRGGQYPDLSTNPAGSWPWSSLSARPSMGRRGGQWWWLGLPGRDAAWELDAAGSPTRWATAAEVPERPRGLWPAAYPSPAPCRTARAPQPVSGSAIFTHRGSGCRAKATGHRGRGPPPTPHSSLQAAAGLDPLPRARCLGWGWGWLCVWWEVRDSLSSVVPQPRLPRGESRKLLLPRTLLTVIWAVELTHLWRRGPGCRWTLGGCRVRLLEPRANECVYKHLLGDGGQGSAQLPLDLPEV